MKRWEYKQVHEGPKQTLDDQLKAAGREGWEAYAVTDYGGQGPFKVWMKREIVQPRRSKNPHVIR